MPQMSETGVVAMVLLCIAGFTLYSILVVLPCWVIAKRRNIAAPWWHWIIPIWNMYTAYRLGNGSNTKLLLIIILLLVGVGAVALQEQAQAFIIGSVVLLSCSFGLGIYVLYCWLRQISVLAGRHPLFLPIVMFIIPLLLALIGSALMVQNIVTPAELKNFENIISLATWIIFLVVALRTPREALSNSFFILTKE
ncbi:hypothetical protein [Halodesulfovibrio marinisediminis]|uniref:Uncharacterized protein n=1 Tax=Halodesulfovibrio marinisediminis DSM 17456 TaxID=1121457 RepID=A0A1N6HH79_9BACT|nr:hypothetical protein [Halodesulfovibrio marinisediminis]SIO19112.1 hypothetical protein SAMN02745161_2206 [Halodesulfovibrio marinisediminis DSM 17456]